jgi:hypothetical protein
LRGHVRLAQQHGRTDGGDLHAAQARVDAVIQRFQQQIDFFRGKLNLPSERWDDITRAAHDRAFIVAGAQQADLLNDLRQAVDKSIGGGSIQQFRQDFAEAVKQSGWTGWTGEGSEAGQAWRTRVIYQTNMATSYAAGRWQQLNDPDLLKARPYWRYVHCDSVTHPRPQHLAWNGLTLPHDDPFWQTHFPPNGWGCQCRVTAVRDPQQGDPTAPPQEWNAIDPRTGAPTGIDKGWNYAPGANADASLQSLIDDKLIKLEAPIGAAMYQTLAPALQAEKIKAFGAFVDDALSDMLPRGKNMVAGALQSGWIVAAQARGIMPATAEIMVRDQDVIHTFRGDKTQRLPLDWYRQLPAHLQNPQAVVLDTTHDQPAYLLVYDVGEQAKKLVVQINYQVRKAGTFNVLDTGRVLDSQSIKGRLGKGYELVDGQL